MSSASIDANYPNQAGFKSLLRWTRVAITLTWPGFSALAADYDSDGSPTNIQYIHDTLSQNGDTVTLPSGIIPDDRTAPWQGNVGVPGGIPNRTTIWKNIVTDLGADPTGAADASPIINSAINSCPAGQVVYMPAGRFSIAAPIYPAAKNNFTLRGAGQGQTILHITTNNVPIYSSGVEPWPPQTTGPAITAGATKGSNTITVSGTSAFIVDALFTISPATPTWAHNLGGFPDTNRYMGGMFKVRSKTATMITFDPPCPFDFSAMNPIAIPWPGNFPAVQGVGYESFTVELADSTAGWAIELDNAWGCWIYDVEVA